MAGGAKKGSFAKCCPLVIWFLLLMLLCSLVSVSYETLKTGEGTISFKKVLKEFVLMTFVATHALASFALAIMICRHL